MLAGVAVVFILLSLLSTEVFAHKVWISAWSEGDFIIGETGSGSPLKLAEIIVEDKAAGTVLLTTKTGTDGKFRFKTPDHALENRLTLRLIVKTGPGHQGEWLLKPEDYLNMAGMDYKSVKLPPATVTDSLTLTGQNQTDCSPPVDAVIIQKIMEDVLNEKLAPIERMLRQEQGRDPKAGEIAAGIGYIFGLFGIFAYWKSRKKK